MNQAVLPKDFLWGFATASYQIEGAANEDGRGPSIWDTFSHTPGKIDDGKTGDIACDAYHHMEEDIALLKSYHVTAYRFSISWSRIIPLGGRNDPINEKGIEFYVKYVDALLEAGITPFVTLYHWDLPQALDDRYKGPLNKEEFVQDFSNYARLVFSRLPKVKHWITFNEPWVSATLGYNIGLHAPGRCSDRTKSPEGDSSREHLIVAHSLLLAHGNAVKIYREEFKPIHGGEIGITLNGDWAEPWDSQDPKDIATCELKLEFSISWFADPIYFGKYPDSMRAGLGDLLPEFTPEEAALVKGSNDFYGLNHYTTSYFKHIEGPKADLFGYLGNLLFFNKNGECIGPETQSFWLRPYPVGFRKLLNWLSKRYGYPKIYVTENGTSVKGENDLKFETMVEDEFRCKFFREYIQAMVEAVEEDGVNVRAYLAWSLMDNFEWSDGYRTRFGVTAVDYENGQKRYPKKSAKVVGDIFGKLIKKK